jgi:hypothetical protein
LSICCCGCWYWVFVVVEEGRSNQWLSEYGQNEEQNITKALHRKQTNDLATLIPQNLRVDIGVMLCREFD